MKDLETMKEELLVRGYFHLDSPIPSEAFESIAEALGPILSDFNVRIDPNRRNYVCKPEAVPFHTDDQANHFMAWHCLDQDGSDGSSILLDVQSILRDFGDGEIEILKTVFLDSPHYVKAADGPKQSSLLVRRDWGWGISYSPWLKPIPTTSPEALWLFRSLSRRIDAANSKENISTAVRLKSGEALFIDNARVLHGRKALPADSRRHLRRLWIGETTQVPVTRNPVFVRDKTKK